MNNILSINRFDEALSKKKWTLKQLAKEYDIKYGSKEGETIYNTLRNWHQGKGNPTLEKLIRICDLLECDVDYLLGRIEDSTHTVKFIREETGLSEDAINTLKAINFRANTQLGDFALMRLSTLNYILKNDEAFENFLGNLAIYIDNNYKTPIFWDPEKHCYIDTGYRYANGDIGVTFGYLTKDNKGNDGYSSLGVSVDILESHAMLQMQGIMKDWKDAHKKES